MQITVELPDEDVRELQAAGIDPATRMKEALLADLVRTREGREEHEQPHEGGSDWDLLDSDTRERFAATGLSPADFEAAARGIRPLPRSDEDRRFAELIRDAKNTEPNVVLHREDIVFLACDDEQIPTLRQFVTTEQGLAHLNKMRAQWERERPDDPQAFHRGMQGLHEKREALFHDLKRGPGRKAKTLGGHREEPERERR